MTLIALYTILNFILVVVDVFILKRKNVDLFQRDIFKNVAVLELAFGALSVMIALMITFNTIEFSKEGASFLVTAGGIKVVQLVILFGSGIVHFFISSIIFFKLFRTDSH